MHNTIAGISYEDFRNAMPGDHVRGDSHFRFEWNSDNGGTVIVTQLTKGHAHVQVATALAAEFHDTARDIFGRAQDLFSAPVERNYANAEVHMEADASFARRRAGTLFIC